MYLSIFPFPSPPQCYIHNQKHRIVENPNSPQTLIPHLILSPNLSHPHISKEQNDTLQRGKQMSTVRFELTHLSIVELKSTALDHSAKLTSIHLKFGLILLFTPYDKNTTKLG